MSMGGTPIDVRGTTPSWVVEATIRALFDELVKTCIKTALIVGESAAIDRAARYVALCTASRWSDPRDCAAVLRPSTMATFFQNTLHICEVAYGRDPETLRSASCLGEATGASRSLRIRAQLTTGSAACTCRTLAKGIEATIRNAAPRKTPW